MKKILMSLMVIAVAVGLVAGATVAQLSDTETSEGNVFTAGTLDLKVDTNPTSDEVWSDDPLPNINSITELNAMVSNMKPGDTISGNFGIKNVGTVDGVADLDVTITSNDDNGCNEPECAAEGGTWDPVTGCSCTGQDCCGLMQGELARWLNVAIEYNDGTTSYHICGPWQFGYLYGHHMVAPVPLLAGQTASWEFVLSIDSDVGGPTVDDNIIQSDKLTFDIEFSLDQAP